MPKFVLPTIDNNLTMKILRLIIVTAQLLSLCSIGAISAQTISDHSSRLLDGWVYHKHDVGGVWEIIRSSNKKSALLLSERVTMPHCFNAYDAVDPDVAYYEGPGWYNKSLKVENPFKDGRTILHFEGAGQKSEVYVGFERAGSHVGGYDEWSVDITDYIPKALENGRIKSSYKGNVPIAVRCDNSRDLEMIPSDLSDFNLYGGLYRYVNLVYVPANYLSQVHIKPEIDGRRSGAVNIKLQSVGGKPFDAEVEVCDPKGKVVSKSTIKGIKDGSQHNFNIKNISRWSDVAPNLYSIVIKTSEGQVYRDRFGFREFKFEEHGPFYLNGERLLLRGTHRHEDFAGVAAAMTEDMIRSEMLLMKEMGVNFIRLGHYQQSRIVLNLCDSLGILVWEEIPWCRGGLGGETYKAQARSALTNMINQHYNHPSVIIWGLGNENDWQGDFPVFDKAKIREFMSELNDLSHKLDDSRKTAIRRCEFCKTVVDVYSPSLWAGWYRGKFIEYKSASKKSIDDVKHFLHVEYGGSSHAYRHDENPDKGLESISTGGGTDERDGDALMTGGKARVSKDGTWSETYICNLFDWHLKEQLTMPWLTGAAQWAFKDFSTPVRPENPLPFMNQKGVVQRDLTKKESFYVFQSYWTESPMAHIYGHSWQVRWGNEGERKMVKVYSNCDKAELFVNGVSQGVKSRDPQNYPAAGLRWNVPFKSGKNSVKVVARKGKREVTDQIEFIYQTEKFDKPNYLELKEISREGNIATIEAKIYDQNGVFCPDAKNAIEFGCAGAAKLIDNLGTVTGSRKIQLYNGRAVISVEMSGDKAICSVTSKGIKSAFTEL